MVNRKDIYFRCEYDSDTIVFSRYDWEHKNSIETDYEMAFQDAYCGGYYSGVKGRFKRAWNAFFAKPITYTSVYCEDADRMRKFLEDCLALMDDTEKEKINGTDNK